MRTRSAVLVAMALSAGGAAAQAPAPPDGAVEIPLRMDGGRLLVTVEGPDGAEYPFVLGLGLPVLTASAADRMGDGRSELTLGGIPVDLAESEPVADEAVGAPGVAGVLGGYTLRPWDVLIDAPNGRMLLEPRGRSVRWDGFALSNPVSVAVYHDVLVRADIEVEGQVFGGLLDLSQPALDLNPALAERAGVDGDAVDFRMGYRRWPALPIRVVDARILAGWDRDGDGFARIGASVASDCVLAISYVREEIRTCVP